MDTLLVMAKSVTQAPNDKEQVMPMRDELAAWPDHLGTLVADHGDFSRSNVEACAEHQVTPLIAMAREVQHRPLAERLKPDDPAPIMDDAVINMAHPLQTKAGQEQ